MVSEIQKYRAQVFQVLAFAFMTPFGKLILDIICNQKINFSWGFLASLLFSLLLVYLGIIFIFKGEEKLEEREKY